LIEAAFQDDTEEAVKLLLGKGANIEAKSNEAGRR